MKGRLLVFLMLVSLAAYAQRPAGTGRPAGAGPGAGAPAGGVPGGVPGGVTGGVGRPSDAGRPADAGTRQEHERTDRSTREQKPLRDEQINSGAFKMLEEKTGKTSEELQAMYTGSGAKNFGEFVSAMVVSQNLGLDSAAVLEGMKTNSLGQTLQNLGLSEERANQEIKKAKEEAKAAGMDKAKEGKAKKPTS
jgi:hypothetical protein